MTRRAACIMLLCAAFFWGAGNVANKTVLDHMGPLTAVALRCLIAAAVIAPFAIAKDGVSMAKGFGASAAKVSLLFAGGLALQQIAYGATTVTNASFLVNTASIITPFVAWAVFGEKQGVRIVIAALFTVLGAFLMTGGQFSISGLKSGDIACLLSAALYAGWTVGLGRHAIRFGRPFATCLVQFGLTSGIVALAAGARETASLSAITAAWPELLMLGVFSTAVAFILMTRAQECVTASTAAVLVSAESLFGAAGGFLVLGEQTPLIGMVGAGVILGAIMLGFGGAEQAISLASTDDDDSPSSGLPDRAYDIGPPGQRQNLPFSIAC